MNEELRVVEEQYLDELKDCEDILEAVGVIQRALVKLGMRKLASKFNTFVQTRL